MSFEAGPAGPAHFARHRALARFPGRNAAIAGAVAASVAIIAGLLVFRGAGTAQYLTASVEQGDIQDVVEETGTVNAVRTVQVGAQVSGTIARLYVDFNSRVHRGDLIASIDPALFQGALDQAVASLHSTQAQLEKDQANLVDARLNYQRDSTLASQNAIAAMTVDNAKSLYDQARAQIAVDSAAVRQIEAAVAVAKANLDYTTIRSPVDGIVVARSVDVGQTVASSFQAPTIFTIAQDPSKMQVYANTDESDVGRIKVGRRVTFKVDAFPNQAFDGTVSQIRMNATTVQNVVTYNTVIDFANPDMKLLPGMTAYVTIPVARVTNVMKVPNSALRFRPPLSPDQTSAQFAKYGIDAGQAAQDETGAGQGRRNPAGGAAIVWKRENSHELRPVKVVTGITDHAYTQVAPVRNGQLQPGDIVATSVESQ
jgi:HlyD family secretion protein